MVRSCLGSPLQNLCQELVLKSQSREKDLRSASLKDSWSEPRSALYPELTGRHLACLQLTFLTRSFSSICPRSLPAACAMRLPATRFPTITEAGPTPVNRSRHQTCEDSSLPNVSGLAQTGSEVHSAMSGIMWSFRHGTKSLYSSAKPTKRYTCCEQSWEVLETKRTDAGDSG